MTSHQGNANQSHNKICFTPISIDIIKNNGKLQGFMKTWRSWSPQLCIVDKYEWLSHYGKHFINSPKR
jgi:hypothetical protein